MRKYEEFVPPTVEEANKFSVEEGYRISGKDFVEYYWVDRDGRDSN